MTLSVRGVLRLLLVLLAAVLTVALAARRLDPVPTLVLLPVVAAALRSGPVVGGAWGLVAGWLVDLIPPGSPVLGSTALLYAAAGALAGRWHRVDRVTWLWTGGVTLVVSAAVEGVKAVVALAAGAPVEWGAAGLRVAATATMAVLVVPLLLTVESRLARRGYT